MKKYLIAFLTILCIGIKSPLAVTSQNIILYNLNDDNVLYEKNSHEKVSIASLTKIMTATVALENISDLSEKVIITSKDFLKTDGYAKAGFKNGDIVTFEDLIYGILLPSGAEAVNATINNTLKENFVIEMNNIAKKIGLENTSFENPIGKDNDNNYSTAEDVAKLLKYALKNPEFKKIFTTKKYTTSNGLVLNSTLNRYSDVFDTNKIIGAKSGFTKNAGRCLASITTLNDVNYLLVVLNADQSIPSNAIKDSLEIYEYYDENYSYQIILDKDEVLKSIPIKFSKEKYYDIKGHENISKYLLNNTKNNLKIVYDGKDEIDYKMAKGTLLGEIKIYDGENLLAKENVYLEKNITYYPLEIWFLVIVIVSILMIFIINKFIKRGKGKKYQKR